jgi:5'-methylthioadenosine phosphorylase
LRVAVIGGSGIYDPDILTCRRGERVDTPFGEVEFERGRHGGIDVIFLQRHGAGHALPPHKINYRANIWALWQAGVEAVVSTSAVGSLNPAMPPGSMVLADQFIDMTRSRASTFFDGGEFGLAHTDFTEPYCPWLRSLLLTAAGQNGLSCHDGGTYLCVDGPRYETPAEIRAFRTLGADLVGMTNAPEVVLARELGLCYATVCLVTNWATGLGQGRLGHGDVVTVMKQNLEHLRLLLGGVLGRIHEKGRCDCGPPMAQVGRHSRLPD